MSYQPPGDDSSPQPSPYSYPSSRSGDYAAQPSGGYLAQPPAGYPVGPAALPYQAGYPQPYGYPGQPPAAAPTSGVAIASLVVSCAGVLGLCAYGLGGYLGVVGAILGHVARRQIRERGEGGDGLALAGVIIGWLTTAIAVIATVAIVFFVVWAARQESGSAPTPFQTF
jgi:hypothetical protein